MSEQVRLCRVCPMENWLGTSKTTHRVGWMIWICYSRALERKCLFTCLSNSLNINIPIAKQSAPLSLHFPVLLRFFFFRMNLCLLRFLSSSRATVKIRSHELPTDFVRFFPGYNALAESPILKPLLSKLWILSWIRSMMTSRGVDFVSTVWFCSPRKYNSALRFFKTSAIARVFKKSRSWD